MMDVISNAINDKTIDTYKILEDRYKTLLRYLLKFFDTNTFMTKEDVELIVQSLENRTFTFNDLYSDNEIIKTEAVKIKDK